MKTNFYSAFFARKFFSIALAMLLMIGTTTNLSAQTYTIFDVTDVPPPGDDAYFDGNNIETGVKFYVTQMGYISAIRFYQSPGSVANKTANLWDEFGNLLSTSGSVAVAGGAGWRQISLPVPIFISSNTTYIASVYKSDGIYAAEQFAFSSAGNVGADPIWAYSALDGGVGGNGVYAFGVGSAFPTLDFSGSNYFIDAVFLPLFPLPVTLANLNAVAKNYDVNLSWDTETETNNDGFEVQRSENGSDYTTITFVDGAGESSSKKSYAYTDRNLNPGLYYYRLRQIDFDGRTKISPVVTATVSRKSSIVLYQSFPNPTSGQTQIQYVLPSTMKVTLSLVDLNGRVIKVMDNGIRQTGSHTVTLDASALMKGIYLYKLETEDQPVEVGRLLVN